MSNGEVDEGVLRMLEDIEADPEAPFYRSWGRTPTATGTAPRPPMPTTTGPGQFVSISAFQAAIDKLAADIRTNSTGIKTVNARVVTSAAKLEKAINTNKKEIDQSIKKVRDTSILPLLLNQPPPLKTITITDKVQDASGKDQIPANTQLVTGYGAGQNQMMPLLLILLMGGLGGSDSKGSGGGDDNSLMLLAVVMMSQSQVGR